MIQKTAITDKTSERKFALLNIGLAKNTSINFQVPFMNKLRSAVEHPPARADELFRKELYDIFRKELYGVPHCLSVEYTDEMHHGNKKYYYHVSNLSCQKHVEMP